MQTSTRVFFALIFSCAMLRAQGSSAQINGTIRDASGLAVPGAAIKATQTATGVVRTTTAANDGGYILPNLPIGPYVMEVTKDGFSKYVAVTLIGPEGPQ